MKNFLLSSSLLLGTLGLNAQTIVSTTPANRNTVLEEFTGIYCTWCPAGHKIANQLSDANPGRVVLVNVHTGGFANPSGNDPDFRTPFGDAIAGQTNLSGYPAGTVNRHEFAGMQQNNTGTAMSRGEWTAAATQVMGQTSPVNVAVDATLDVATREVTVLVEIYYTDPAAAGTTNKLNVALLQSNVKGPQTGGAANYPEMLDANGDYTHNHMLRHLLTGQWGEDITVANGPFISKTYTYTLPNDYNGVPVGLNDLSIAAYIAEGQQEVITGVDQHIDLPANAKTELSISKSTQGPSDYCATSVTPTLEVTNNHSTPITSFDISYSLNGGAAVSESFSGNLAQGQSTTITFPAVTLAGGENIISYGGLNNINGGLLVDTVPSTPAADVFLTVPAQAVAAPFDQGFESATVQEMPANVFAEAGDASIWVIDNTIVNGLNTPLGGFLNSDKSVFFDYYSIQSGSIGFYFEKTDMTTISSPMLKFSHAYAPYNGGEADQLEVLVSTDCGANWTSVWDKSANDLATAAATTNRFFPQAANEWAADSVDLAAYTNESELMIKFLGTSGYGNALYVDDINITGGPVGINDVFVDNSVSLFPVPAQNNVTVNFNLKDASEVNVRIVDMTGKVVFNQANGFTAGVNTLNVNVEDLANGIYTVELVSGESVTTKRLVISK